MKRITLLVLFIVVVLLISGGGAALASRVARVTDVSTPLVVQTSASLAAADSTPTVAPAASSSSPLPASNTIAAYEGALEDIYTQVSPSVVLIQVIEQAAATTGRGTNPFLQQGPQTASALGSGFVWDTQGHIVTNNHVIDGATKITVIFNDGSQATAKLVGADPQSDLAVIQVSVPASQLHPVQVGDSTTVKVGQLAVAIGNPFGEQNTMTTGIISALGRFLPVDMNATGPTYTIPDVIQTDTPINPGNSGGVLLNAQGLVIGVTSAIESNANSSAGVGFAIPAEVVKQVIPSLISSGKFDHPYLGISGTSLTPDLATAMNLDANQRGAMVADVTAGGPADQAGVKGSTQNTTIDGTQVQVGGDVIIALNGQTIKTFDDLVASLALSTKIGDKAQLTVLRAGKQQTLTVTIGARPATAPQPAATSSGQSLPFFNFPGQTTPTTGGAYLGIQGLSLSSALDQAMNLPANQQGVLILQVSPSSPADDAGLKGGTTSTTVGGQTVMTGGDVIVGVGRQSITSLQDLQTILASAQPNQRITLRVLRDGQTASVPVTLGQAPTTSGG